MNTTVILASAVVLLCGLLLAEKKENLKGILLTKPLLSALFIATALLQPHSADPYFYLILAGLVLCFAGDICLIFFFNRKVFTAGLAFFLTGHILYVLAFFITAGFTTGAWISLAVMSVISFFVFTRLRPHLGSMVGPVIAYITIISVMVVAAFPGSPSRLQPSGPTLVIAGSILFYVSDLLWHDTDSYKNRQPLCGLPMYYAAQFMLAFSVGMIP